LTVDRKCIKIRNLDNTVNVRARFVLFLLTAVVAVARPAGAQAPPQRVVRQLEFRGNHALDDLTLKSFIATSESSWAARYWWIRWLGVGEKHYLDETELRRDVVRVILIYRQAGYMDVTVDTLVRRDPANAFVTFVVYEGEPVRVRRIDLVGVDTLLDVARLRRDLPLQVGDPFNRALFQASADTITALLRHRGYPYADVLRSFDADATSLVAEVTLEAVPGPRMRIGEVRVEGLERVSLGTVRRLVPMRGGEWYSDVSLTRAQRELYDLGVFRYVDVQLVDSGPPEAPADTAVSVLIRLAEGKRHRVRAGLGYATEECVRAQAGWTMGNFLGGGRTLDVGARAGMIGVGYPTGGLGIGGGLCGSLLDDFTADTMTYSLGASVRQIGFPGLSHATSVGLFTERRAEPRAYVREAHGVNLGVTFNVRTRGPVAVAYSYSLGSTQAPAGVYCSVFQACTEEDQAFLSQERPFAGIAVTAVRRRTDAVLDPSIGSLASATWLTSTPTLGSDPFYSFNRGEASFASYYRVGRRSVLAWRVWGGAILKRIVQTTSDTARYVPPEHRFYAGGPNSVRGFSPNELGPLVYVTRDTTRFDSTAAAQGDTIYSDVRASPTGGSSALVANLELRVPAPVFTSRMHLTFFVDVGQVWDEAQGLYFSLGDLRVTPGVGLRFSTPLGPVRIEAGYNGYAREVGPLYFETDSSIVRIRESYSTPRPTSFFRRLTLQFAVGPTF
jgi:outer membrane protein insertion porin family/translocation and assembly module TamA